jgi:prolyl oligopeptidase
MFLRALGRTDNMKLHKLALGLALAGAFAGLAAAENTKDLTPDSPDPFLWLADIHGEKPLAWVKDQNEKTLAVLKSDPEYQKNFDAMMAVLNANDRIPMGEVDHGEVFNFWQDANHVRGLWRRTSIADYAHADPAWDVLLDIDQLDAKEHKNWVWGGGRCVGQMTHCLVRLSPGGSDASVVREFDPKTKTFPADGFTLPVAKSDTAYLNENTILFGTDFGPGSMTQSSYPRIVKIWHRGEPISAAKTVFEAKVTDVAARPIVFRGAFGTIPIIERGLTFFTSEFYAVHNDGTTTKLPLPPGADLKGVTRGNLIFTLRDNWTPPGAKPIAKGSLVAFNVLRFAVKKTASYIVLYTPDARGTIADVEPGRDAVYAAIFENVTGAVHAFHPDSPDHWIDTNLDLPKGGSTHVMSADAWTPQAYLTFESFLDPVTLYAFDAKGAPTKIKSEPARFDARGLVSDQLEATSADGTKVPYFLIHAKAAKGPVPTILYSSRPGIGTTGTARSTPARRG